MSLSPVPLKTHRVGHLGRIRKLGLVWKYSRWLSKKLNEKNYEDRFIVSTSILARKKIEPFSNTMITVHKKRISMKSSQGKGPIVNQSLHL
ncbi:hypothetical protein TNCV_5019981 [Trichonephila clavipes]|nr:hypothetical protein TNCV_5019981 [Trichonephila clavipes]